VSLTAYLDESGTHDGSRLTVMAGWVGYTDRWRDFDRKWNALLLRPLAYRGSITTSTERSCVKVQSNQRLADRPDRCAARRNYNRVELELVPAGRSMTPSREKARWMR
jgi:hypothetical protein